MTRNRTQSNDDMDYKKRDNRVLREMEEEEEEAKAKEASALVARAAARTRELAALAAAPAILTSQINAITTTDEYVEFITGKGFTPTQIFSDNTNVLNIKLFRNKTYSIYGVDATLNIFLDAKEDKLRDFIDDVQPVGGLKYLQGAMDKFLTIRGSTLPLVNGPDAGENLYNRTEACVAGLYDEIMIPFYLQINAKYKDDPEKGNMSFIFGRFIKSINYYLDILEKCKGTLINLDNINDEATGTKIVKRVNYIIEDMNGTTIETNLINLKTLIHAKINAVDINIKFVVDVDKTMVDGRRRSRRKSRRSKRSSKKRSDGKKRKSKSRRSKRSSKKRSSKKRSDGRRKSRRTRRKSRRSKKRSTRRRY